MARFVLNETSYHGKGVIAEIATEIRARGFKKAFVCSDPDLIKFGVTKKVTDVLVELKSLTTSTPTSNPILQLKTFRQVLKRLRQVVLIAS